MKGLKRVVFFLLVILFLFTITSCTQKGARQEDSKAEKAATAKGGEVLKIKFSWQMPVTHFTTQAGNMIKNIVEEKSGGKIIVETYPGGQLYKDKDTNQAVSKGVVEMAFNTASWWSDILPAIQVLDLPYLYPSDQAYIDALNGDLGKEISKFLEKQNVKVLSWLHYGCVGFYGNNVREIRKPEDLKGMKMRSFNEVMEFYMQSMGASTVHISSAEVYTALQRGTFDGTFSGASSFNDRKWKEVIKYGTESYSSFAAFPVMVNLQWWNGLSPENQKIIQQAAEEASKWCLSVAVQENDNAREEMKKAGVKVILLSGPEIAKFRDRVGPTYDYYKKIAGPDGERLLEIAKKYSKWNI